MGSQAYDVIIVGAGPAGATAAYSLARAGARVLVVDKARLPRYKTCGGGVTAKTARLLPYDISPVVERTITQFAITRRLGDLIKYCTDTPLVYMVMRDRFDYFLVEQAQAVGAEVIDNCPIQQINVSHERITVATRDNRQFDAQVLVGADGANSVVARALGLLGNTVYAIGLEQEVRVAATDLVSWQALMLFDLASIHCGYGWIFPKGDHLSIGVGALAVDSTRLRQYQSKFDSFCRSFMSSYEILHAQGHRLPIRLPGTPIHGPRTLLVGDAAGLVNPVDGEGMYYAIRSAQIAAPFILQALAAERAKHPDFSGYQQAIDAELMPELRSAWILMRAYSLAPWFFARVLVRSDRARRGVDRILRGDIRYADLYRRLGPAGRVLSLMLGGRSATQLTVARS